MTNRHEIRGQCGIYAATTSSALFTFKEREDFILNSLLNFVKSLGKRVPDETNTGGARLVLKTFWPGSIGVRLD